MTRTRCGPSTVNSNCSHVTRLLVRADTGTPVATTVHELQVREEDWGADAHDVPVDLVVTPVRVVETGTDGSRNRKPAGIDWEALPEERLTEIPVLQELRRD